MKISNKKSVKKIAWITLMLIIVSVLILILSTFTTIILYHKTVSFLIIPCLVILFLRIRFTEIDVSGGCFTIRKIHPFAKKGYVSPRFEFPACAIRQMEISNGFVSRRVKILMVSRTVRKRCQLNLFFFNRKQLARIEMLLQKNT